MVKVNRDARRTIRGPDEYNFDLYIKALWGGLLPYGVAGSFTSVRLLNYRWVPSNEVYFGPWEESSRALGILRRESP